MLISGMLLRMLDFFKTFFAPALSKAPLQELQPSLSHTQFGVDVRDEQLCTRWYGVAGDECYARKSRTGVQVANRCVGGARMIEMRVESV